MSKAAGSLGTNADLSCALAVICRSGCDVRHVRSVRTLAGGHHLEEVLLGGA
jgi:hypothetical protein